MEKSSTKPIPLITYKDEGENLGHVRMFTSGKAPTFWEYRKPPEDMIDLGLMSMQEAMELAMKHGTSLECS